VCIAAGDDVDQARVRARAMADAVTIELDEDRSGGGELP
jgi:hypothetical protein